MGIFQWVQGKLSSIYQGVQTAVAVTSGIIVATGDILTSSSFRQGFANWFIQSWQGFARMLDPSIVVSLITRPKTSRVLMNGQAAALMRLVPALLYQAGIRPLVGPAVRASVCDNAWVEFAAVSSLDLAATLYFTRNTVRGFADSSVAGMAMAKASADESLIQSPGHNPLVDACPDDVNDQAAAGLNSTIYYYGNRLALHALACSLPYGNYLSLPLQAIFYGRTFLEYPLGAAGNCMDHRLEVLNKNNPYAMGLGASFLVAHRVLQALIERYTGARGYFIDEALASMLSLHFIMVTNLSRNLPLPGTKPGIDPFYQSRVLTDSVAKETVSYIERHFKSKEEGDWYQDLKQTLHRKWQLPAVRAARFALLDESLQDYEKLALRSTSRLYLELCGEDIEQALKGIIEMRADTYYQTVDYFKDFMPDVRSGERKKLSAIMNKYLDQPLNEWLYFIKRVRDPNFHLDEGVDKKKYELYAAIRQQPMSKERPRAPVVLPSQTTASLYGEVRHRPALTAQSMPVMNRQQGSNPN